MDNKKTIYLDDYRKNRNINSKINKKRKYIKSKHKYHSKSKKTRSKRWKEISDRIDKFLSKYGIVISIMIILYIITFQNV